MKLQKIYLSIFFMDRRGTSPKLVLRLTLFVFLIYNTTVSTYFPVYIFRHKDGKEKNTRQTHFKN